MGFFRCSTATGRKKRRLAYGDRPVVKEKQNQPSVRPGCMTVCTAEKKIFQKKHGANAARFLPHRFLRTHTKPDAESSAEKNSTAVHNTERNRAAHMGRQDPRFSVIYLRFQPAKARGKPAYPGYLQAFGQARPIRLSPLYIG